ERNLQWIRRARFTKDRPRRAFVVAAREEGLSAAVDEDPQRSVRIALRIVAVAGVVILRRAALAVLRPTADEERRRLLPGRAAVEAAIAEARDVGELHDVAAPVRHVLAGDSLRLPCRRWRRGEARILGVHETEDAHRIPRRALVARRQQMRVDR